MELIKFSEVGIEEADALFNFLASKYSLKEDPTDPLKYCNDFFVANYRPEHNTLILDVINEQEVTDVDLPGYYASFIELPIG